jgi:hypothetical protein
MQIEEKVTAGSEEIAAVILISGAERCDLDLSGDDVVGKTATDLEVAAAFKVAKLLGIYLVSDQNLKLETNSGSAPGNTINLVANKPLVWHPGNYFANPFTVNVTAFFFTNTSGEDATVRMKSIIDPT